MTFEEYLQNQKKEWCSKWPEYGGIPIAQAIAEWHESQPSSFELGELYGIGQLADFEKKLTANWPFPLAVARPYVPHEFGFRSKNCEVV